MKIKTEIQEIVTEADLLQQSPYNDDYKKRMNFLMNRFKMLDEKSSPGLNVGRQLKFNVADGYAYYIVTKVNKSVVEVVHVPLDDSYCFAGVCIENGKLVMLRGVAEQNVKMAEFFTKTFVN